MAVFAILLIVALGLGDETHVASDNFVLCFAESRQNRTGLRAADRARAPRRSLPGSCSTARPSQAAQGGTRKWFRRWLRDVMADRPAGIRPTTAESDKLGENWPWGKRRKTGQARVALRTLLATLAKARTVDEILADFPSSRLRPTMIADRLYP